MAVRMKIPQAAGIRRSVEVQHGGRGLLLMFRRGLHGAKNWTLEREEDGSHRSVWVKLFRVAVVLTPLWIVLSAVTGGPERGGHSASVGQSFFMALLVLVVGLAVFSARERRAGREEPWADLKSHEPESTESDDGPEGESEEVSSEGPTQVLENPQVEASGSDPDEVFHADENDESEQKTQIIPTAVPQAIENEAKTLVIPGPEAIAQPVQTTFEQATSESAVDLGVPQERNTPLEVSPEMPRVVLDKAIDADLFQQVTADIEEDWPDVPQAVSEGPESPVTESERNDLPDTPTVPFRPASREVSHETETPQVEVPEEPVREPVQDAFQCLFAESGPYPVGADPVAEDWWVVKPDVPATEPQEEPLEVESGENSDHDPWADVDASEGDGEPDPVLASAASLYSGEVQRYFASRVSVDVSEQERSAARIAVMAWAVQEVNEGRRSQSEVARLLGIGKATVSRWVSAGTDDEGE